MQIRLATVKDKHKVLKLLDELGEEVNRVWGYSPHNTEAQKVGGPVFDEIIKRTDTLIFVADNNGILVGAMTLYLLPNMRHGYHRGHVEDMVVSESVRGQGIGSRLFDAMKEYCRTNGIKVVKLDSGNELTNAHKFYEKNGGKQTEKMFRFNIT